jgi:hypothetical protein
MTDAIVTEICPAFWVVSSKPLNAISFGVIILDIFDDWSRAVTTRVIPIGIVRRSGIIGARIVGLIIRCR